MKKAENHRLLCFILAVAFVLGTAGMSFAEENTIAELLYNDPFEYMIALTDKSGDAALPTTEEEKVVDSSAADATTVSDDSKETSETIEERLKRHHLERAERKHKTDRYIVKYKSDAHREKVSTKLDGRIKTKREFRKKEAKNSRSKELIILDEPVKPQEFAGELTALDLESSIEYIQPDYILNTEDVKIDVVPVSGSVEQSEDVAQAQSNEAFIAERPVVVAVIDSGADIAHPMLKKYLWEDSEGNNGRNFVDNNNVLYDSDNALSYAHGTHVSGIIVQTARASGTPVKLMICRAFSDGCAYTSDVIAAIEYAESNGAEIINMSFGGTEYNPALEEAIKESSALFVAAAGNHRVNLNETPVYPACFDLENIICVAAANRDKGYSYFSNYSSSYVDIVAPGREIKSAYPERKYGLNSGTSMAAAYISGTAAAVAARNINSISGIKARIYNTADRFSHLQDKANGERHVNLKNMMKNITSQEILTAPVKEDFDPTEYDPTPSEQLELFSQRTIVDVAVGKEHTLLLASDGTVWGFGKGSFGALGNGDYINIPASSPTQVLGLTGITAIDVGDDFSIARKSDGTVWAWGAMTGTANSGICYSPVQVTGIQNAIDIGAGATHVVVSCSDGYLYGWGTNYYGELLQDPNDWPDTYTAPYYNTPIALTPLYNTYQIECGDFTTAVLLADSLKMAGTNNYGQLKTSGVNSSYNLIGDQNEFYYSFDLGDSHAVAAEENFKAWGYNGSGQLGTVSAAGYESTPQVVIITTDQPAYANFCAAGSSHSLFVYDDMLYGCGSNARGQLANVSVTSYTSTPTYIADDIAGVYAGGDNTVIKKTDNTVWICGDNRQEQIDGTETAMYTAWQQVGDYGSQSVSNSDSLTLDVASGEEYNVIVSAAFVTDMYDSYTVEFSASYFDVITPCALTNEEVVIGQITPSGVTVTNTASGKVSFSRNIVIPNGYTAWNGAVNVIRLRAKQSGTATITCTSGGVR